MNDRTKTILILAGAGKAVKLAVREFVTTSVSSAGTYLGEAVAKKLVKPPPDSGGTETE